MQNTANVTEYSQSDKDTHFEYYGNLHLNMCDDYGKSANACIDLMEHSHKDHIDIFTSYHLHHRSHFDNFIAYKYVFKKTK